MLSHILSETSWISVDNDYRWPMFLFLHFSNCNGQSLESSKLEAIYREGQRGQRYLLRQYSMMMSPLSRKNTEEFGLHQEKSFTFFFLSISISLSRSLLLILCNYLTNFTGSWKTSSFTTPLCSFSSPPQYKWSPCTIPSFGRPWTWPQSF